MAIDEQLEEDYVREVEIPQCLLDLKASTTYKRFIDLILISRPNKAKKGLDKHHIIPRAKGGSNSKDNIIYLTREEHLQAHRLLFLDNPCDLALQRAYSACASFNKPYVTAEEFEFISRIKRYQMQNFNPTYVEKHRIVLSKQRLGDKNPACKPDQRVALYADKDKTKIVRLFYSAFEAAQAIVTDELSDNKQAAAITIRHACNNRIEHAYGLYWGYITDKYYRELLLEKYNDENM